MSDLTATDLANMRADVGEMLPDTCVIQAATETVNSIGESVASWAAAGTVACRLDPLRQDETLLTGRITAQGDFVLTVAYDTSLTAAMRVVAIGVTYEVVGVDTGKSSAVNKRAILRRVA